MDPQSNVYIYNSRDNGENSNWLGATYDKNGNFIPVLAIKGENLPFYLWSITQDGPGLPFHLEIADKSGTYYRLSAPVEPTSGAICSLQPSNNPQPSTSFILWCLSDLPRILLGWDLCNTDPNPLALDAGAYPQVMIWNSVKSVNQTWACSSTPPLK